MKWLMDHLTQAECCLMTNSVQAPSILDKTPELPLEGVINTPLVRMPIGIHPLVNSSLNSIGTVR